MDVGAILVLAVKAIVCGGLLIGLWAVFARKGRPFDPNDPNDTAW